MQSRGARVALVVVAVAVAVAAFMVLSSSDDEEEPTAVTRPAQISGGKQEGEGEAGPGRSGGERAGNGATVIAVEDGTPVGGVAEIEVSKGEPVRLVVRADVADEVHVHGYDLFADVAPDKPAELEFTADADGVYEVELERSQTEIAALTVEP
jgi:hypothetical protein